ncbi:hypothetical protein GGTG_11708 [Gaeumannomyces tritici R3-111a-1]|uniref:Uncharacterized protein n=1 Tax=Gaeumannomyces tritici (strain R3-111a-1) TaxID=644352 RepID=J3PDY5_GAET3|nr:hypothetical protein GGTG_11708 [Gaeumannomyces tritici R3-111a-1]EJT70685.1 hypothetical protein GGTG_11708 [Gaeumannomyces tritici R3-111a-1]
MSATPATVSIAKRIAWQPLNPDARDQLDPQYVKLHDEVLVCDCMNASGMLYVGRAAKFADMPQRIGHDC